MFWKRYYYSYLESFVQSLLLPGECSFRVNPSQTAKKKVAPLPTDEWNYIVASDILGHVHDIDTFFLGAGAALAPDGRLIITQYSTLWEPVLRLASKLGMRNQVIEQNWLTKNDIKNFATLAQFEVVRMGTKMIAPIYLPIISVFLNQFLSNLWPFNHLGLFNFFVLRKVQRPNQQNLPSISIVVPALNEMGTIEKIARELPQLGSGTEIIFIEGNSTDKTYAEIERVARAYGATRKIKFAQQSGRGKGDAVRCGFELATGDILAIYDADMTVPPEEMDKFFRAIVSYQADFINGSRLVYPMEKESMRLLNFLGNKFFSSAFSWILGQQLKDTLCGTKVLWRKDYQKIIRNRKFFGDFDPFGDFDLLFGAAKLNLKIIDLPVHYRERVYGATNIRRIAHGWLLIKMVIFALKKIKFI